MCVVSVASYDNFMLFNSYLAFVFLFFFSMTTLLQLGVCFFCFNIVTKALCKANIFVVPMFSDHLAAQLMTSSQFVEV